MKKAKLFYFSGTGNTWWISEQLARRLRDKGIAAQAYSVEQLDSEKASRLLDDCDLVGFGYPIYGSDLPEPMKIFMRNLPECRGKPCFTYCTQWLWSGDGARTGADFLKPKGFDVGWGEHFLMLNNVCIELIRLPFTNDPSKMNGVLRRALRKVEFFAERIAAGRPFRRGFNPVSFLLGCLQRLPFRKVFPRLKDDIGVDRERCTLCRQCAELCPMRNIVFEGASFTTRGSCVLCLRCYNFCPTSAITYRGRRHNLKRGVPYRGPVRDFDPFILRPEKNQ